MDLGKAEIGEDFDAIVAKAMSREELGVDEGERLLQSEGDELLRLIEAADMFRRRLVGEVVTYVKNRNINFTNICVGSCRFCAFRRSRDDPDAYLLTQAQMKEKVKEAVKAGAIEVCVQGGLHPELGLEDYLGILRTIREVSSTVHIHAFSPAEIFHIAKSEGLSVEETVTALKAAGLDSVPGTAAEILVERVRSIICPEKISTEEWCEVIKTCHRMGIPSTATVLYGTVETPRELAEHIALIRSVQEETGGFTEFVPLAFMPKNTPLEEKIRPPSIIQSLRVHAVARLMLAGKINNIQASWVKLGPWGAKLMLMAGANDLGGTLMEENITRAAGGRFHSMTVGELERIAVDIGRTPRQRTTTYQILQ